MKKVMLALVAIAAFLFASWVASYTPPGYIITGLLLGLGLLLILLYRKGKL